jgi:hypothetical protein
MGLAFGLIGLVYFVIWNVDITFVGEMRFADKENIYSVLRLFFFFLMVL